MAKVLNYFMALELSSEEVWSLLTMHSTSCMYVRDNIEHNSSSMDGQDTKCNLNLTLFTLLIHL